MHLIENLSLRSGLKIDKPSVEELFFPIVPEKYITIHTEDHQSKQWDHIQSCIDLLRPILDKENIVIVEIGYNQVPLRGVMSVKNVTTLNQAAYIIKNSLLHIGTEGLFIQMASAFNSPLISLFSNTSIEYAGPRWGDGDNEILIESHIPKGKRSYSAQENPKSINSIFPEEIAGKALDLLGVQHDLMDYTPLYSGKTSFLPCIEVVPDFEPNHLFHPRTLLNVRMDYSFNETHLPHFANQRKIAIISDKPISRSALDFIRPSLEHFFFIVSPDSDLEYATQIKAAGIPLTLLGKAGEDLSLTRLTFFDWAIEDPVTPTKKTLDKDIDICDNTYFKSMKTLYSKGSQYPCKYFWEQGIKKEKFNKVIDHPDFWKEVDHYRIYTKNG